MRNLLLVLFTAIWFTPSAHAFDPPGGKVLFTGSTVTLSYQDGRTIDLFRVSVTQETTGEVATQTWKSGGTDITVTTPRREFNNPQQVESLKGWAQRHKDNVEAFKKLFPPDPQQRSAGGGDAIGSIPSISPPKPPPPPPSGSVTFKWKSGVDDVEVSATPRLDETPDQFAYRVAAAVHAHQLTFPPN